MRWGAAHYPGQRASGRGFSLRESENVAVYGTGSSNLPADSQVLLNMIVGLREIIPRPNIIDKQGWGGHLLDHGMGHLRK